MLTNLTDLGLVASFHCMTLISSYFTSGSLPFFGFYSKKSSEQTYFLMKHANYWSCSGKHLFICSLFTLDGTITNVQFAKKTGN